MNRPVITVAAAACAVLAAACAQHAGGARAHVAASRASPAGASAAVLRGTPNMVAARNGYTATIVPLYPRATDLADEVANHPSLAAIPAAQFAAALRQARARLAGVTAFPGAAQPAFAAFQADSETVLGDLAGQASARAAAANGAVPGTAARYKAAADLYALAHQIGVLGVGLGLLPGAAPSAASTGAGG